MNLLTKLRSIYKVSSAFISLSIASLLLKYIPNKEFIWRKWASKSVSNLIVSEEIHHGVIDQNADLYILNHSSMADIILFEHVMKDTDTVWVAKEELADIFLFGNLTTKTNMITINRNDKRSIIDLIKKTKDNHEKKRKICIFPEGTRSKNRGVLGEFKPGAKIVAEKLNFKVQPILLLGVKDMVQEKPFKISKVPLHVYALETVEAKKGTDWFIEVEKKMQEIVKKELNEL